MVNNEIAAGKSSWKVLSDYKWITKLRDNLSPTLLAVSKSFKKNNELVFVYYPFTGFVIGYVTVLSYLLIKKISVKKWSSIAL